MTVVSRSGLTRTASRVPLTPITAVGVSIRKRRSLNSLRSATLALILPRGSFRLAWRLSPAGSNWNWSISRVVSLPTRTRLPSTSCSFKRASAPVVSRSPKSISTPSTAARSRPAAGLTTRPSPRTSMMRPTPSPTWAHAPAATTGTTKRTPRASAFFNLENLPMLYGYSSTQPLPFNPPAQ